MKKLSRFNDGLNVFDGVEFNLKRKPIRNLIIKVNSKNKIDVSIPLKVDDKFVIKFLEVNIHKFDKYAKDKNEKKSINNEDRSFYLFGEVINYDLDETNKKIIINNKKISYLTKSIDEAIDSYRKKQLKVYLLVRQLQLQKQMNIVDHLIRVRSKVTAWATNHVNDKVIYYSTNLSSFSKEIIDYVIIHELSHNKHPNHSKDFWDFVQKYEPSYKAKRLKLKKSIYS